MLFLGTILTVLNLQTLSMATLAALHGADGCGFLELLEEGVSCLVGVVCVHWECFLDISVSPQLKNYLTLILSHQSVFFYDYLMQLQCYYSVRAFIVY